MKYRCAAQVMVGEGVASLAAIPEPRVRVGRPPTSYRASCGYLARFQRPPSDLRVTDFRVT